MYVDYPGLLTTDAAAITPAPMVITAKVANGQMLALPQKSSVPEQAKTVLMAPNNKNAPAPTSAPAN